MAAPVASKVTKGPRACATCAKAKSRCIAGPKGQDKCERCHRLQKPCSSQTPAPARKRKEPKPTRVAELERRLEDLTARIESVQRLGQTEPSPPNSDHYVPPSGGAPADIEDPLPPPGNLLSESRGPTPTYSRDRWDPFGHLFPDRSIFETRPDHQQPTSSSNAASVGQNASPPVPPIEISTQPTASSPYQQPVSRPSQHQVGCPWPQGDEAEAFLRVYREKMAHLFPFVVVPPDLSPAHMREQRPFLWKAIMMEACVYEGARQVALGNELLKEVSEAALVRPEKNIDLLHGLQLLIAWYHYNLDNFQMVNLLFLARSITLSLGSAEVKGFPGDGRYSSELLELMRAFAGTYYLVTITFTTNKRPDALMNNMNTSYLATCCQALHSQMEYPTDELAVHLVRTQQLSQSILQAFSRRKAVSDENQPSPRALIPHLMDRIQGFAASLPPHIRADPSLAGHLHVAEILVYENSLEELSQCPFEKPSRGRDRTTVLAASVDEADPKRLELLWQCARVVTTFMKNRFSEEIGDYPRFVCVSSFDLTYVFLTMLRLVTLQVPGWDLAVVAKELPFNDFTTWLIHRMEYTVERRKRKSKPSVASDADVLVGWQEDDFGDPYLKLTRKLRNVRDSLNLIGFDNDYATSQVARVCNPAPMTVADATQDLMQDLGAGLWQDVTGGPPDWDSFFVGKTVDWSAVLNNYSMATESGYMA
ncbi:hypothetical protein N657DRAFT_573578 [Parathielavia appendiculata]|uniref:Zn(2)-C6 fungal-type domain-containing protein n=1 Tax=Parathielavia appendiculata TaxID=2587402 RepID=A0AAN6U007_9PEZI|nr:hypothetical protein N657DRAFT_573578 [Parathielavia appendiculata]